MFLFVYAKGELLLQRYDVLSRDLLFSLCGRTSVRKLDIVEAQMNDDAFSCIPRINEIHVNIFFSVRVHNEVIEMKPRSRTHLIKSCKRNIVLVNMLELASNWLVAWFSRKVTNILVSD